MSKENKRFYWLKLKEDFFEDDTMKWLEEQENGKDYIIFYLKLSLKSLKDNGGLIRYVGEKLIPYDTKALARLTNTNHDTVSLAMKLFIEIGLVQQMDSGEIYMNQIHEMIGSETDKAALMRKKRAREKELGDSNNVTSKLLNVTQSKSKSKSKNESENESENIEAEKYPAAAQAYYENNVGMIKPVVIEDLTFYSDKFDEPDAIIIEAIDISIMRSKRNWGYVKAIIQGWRSEGLKTLSDVRGHEKNQGKNNNTAKKLNLDEL